MLGSSGSIACCCNRSAAKQAAIRSGCGRPINEYGALFAATDRMAAWVARVDRRSELKRRLDRGEAVTVVDVRGRDEFVGPLGHIATARNIPVAEFEGRLAELAGLEGEPIVLVCRTDKRSASAARTLLAAGFARVSLL